MSLGRARRTRYLLGIMVVVLSFLAGACGLRVSEEERNAVYNLIEWNLYYARIEDMNGYMWTLHPASPVYSETQTQMAVMFREFDLAYDVEQWELISINSEEARVRVVQATRKLAGAQPFRDNRLEVIHTLRKDSEGEWKLYYSELTEGSLEYLDAIAP
jgi:hypothetical protein